MNVEQRAIENRMKVEGTSRHEYGVSGVRGMDRVSIVEDVEL